MRILDMSPRPLPPPPPPPQKQLWKKEKKWEIGLEGRKELALYVLLEESLDTLKVTILPWLMVGIFDLRQRQLRHTFLAHDAPVKSIVVDENEEFFISGSEDGDIKVTTSCTSKLRAIEMFTFYWRSNMFSKHCVVPVRRFARPSRSIHFGDVSEANWREMPHFSARTMWPETQ